MSLSARPHPITTYYKTTNIYVLVTFCTDTDSDEDDDEEEQEEVVIDTEWDDLESEDALIDIPSSMYGPFPFLTGGSEFVRMAEAGRTIGPSSEQVGAG